MNKSLRCTAETAFSKLYACLTAKTSPQLEDINIKLIFSSED